MTGRLFSGAEAKQMNFSLDEVLDDDGIKLIHRD